MYLLKFCSLGDLLGGGGELESLTLPSKGGFIIRTHVAIVRNQGSPGKPALLLTSQSNSGGNLFTQFSFKRQQASLWTG